MKKIIGILALSILFADCKYEDGPKLSLRTKKHRAVNTWHIDKVFENGMDKTTDYKNAFVNYQIDLKSDNTYELKYRPFNLSDYLETGNWAFSNDKVFINFTPKDSKSPGQWKILRLTETETWVIQNINGKDVELRMKD
jgi:hypothetical protein